jgi:hypothetical protein
MTPGIRIRHVVSIAGAVRDQASALRVAGVLVEIVEGPPAFRALLDALAVDPAWAGRRERLDRVYSQSDGIFCFVDLPAGPYRLRASAPAMGTRYGAVETGPLQVQADPGQGPVPAAQVEIDLPPTRVHGLVSDAATGQPIPAARVHLLGDTAVVKTRYDGSYDLSCQVAGKPRLHAVAPRYRAVTRQIELAAGQERVENLALQPE